jgi:hypothetical protein
MFFFFNILSKTLHLSGQMLIKLAITLFSFLKLSPDHFLKSGEVSLQALLDVLNGLHSVLRL